MYRALIVDDEISVCKGLSVLINWRAEGFEVAGYAYDGECALDLIKREPFDLIISDIRMPGLTGLELLSQLERLRIHTKLIIISAYSDFEYAQRAISHGAMGYLLKPINEALLIDALHRVRERLDAEETRPIPTPAQRLAQTPGELINAIIVQLNEAYDGSVTISSLACQYYTTPARLTRLFKARMGMGLSEYLSAVRVEKAKRMLANPDIMIYEIASRVGFKDVDYFCQIFKQAVGITPSAYRKGQLGNR